jgi:hypothetical protein
MSQKYHIKINWRFCALLTALIFCISCNKKPVFQLPPEPVDPDHYDMSVWRKILPGVYSGFGSIDTFYLKNIPPMGKITESIKLQGWKGERINCLLLVWTSDKNEKVSITANDFENDNFKIGKDKISISVLRYVLTDEFLNENSGSCGPRDNSKVPVHITPDLLSGENVFNLEGPATRPVWISVDIPPETPAGIYTGTITRKSKSGVEQHSIRLEVINKRLPDPSEWAFHLDLWQNPFAVARFHNVELWSEEHLQLLSSYLSFLANAGQKCITTTIIDKPWGQNKPCYDDYWSMINWIKKKDGSWEYDYAIFDTYVKLAMECGIKKQINCYTMIPIDNNFIYFDEERSETVVEKLFPGTKEYEDHWRPFLADFKNHLIEMGWLGITTIALDERDEEEMAKMFSFMKEAAPDFKIAMAGFYHASINSSIYDFCSNWRDYGRIPTDSIQPRKEAGLITTYYVACGIPKPNNFTFSPPAESCFEGWIAAAMGFDGFLRWAYNSWPENPLVDSRYTKWPAGDTYFIYPGPLSSVRFERLREGIQDYEKIRILRKEFAENKLPEVAASMERLNSFLTSIDSKTLDKRSAAEVINEGKQLIYTIAK